MASNKMHRSGFVAHRSTKRVAIDSGRSTRHRKVSMQTSIHNVRRTSARFVRLSIRERQMAVRSSRVGKSDQTLSGPVVDASNQSEHRQANDRTSRADHDQFARFVLECRRRHHYQQTNPLTAVLVPAGQITKSHLRQICPASTSEQSGRASRPLHQKASPRLGRLRENRRRQFTRQSIQHLQAKLVINIIILNIITHNQFGIHV